jgi:hypothetical protein
VQTEADPLDPDPPAPLRTAPEAYLYLEQAATTIEWGEGLVLRYGGFYGPGTAISLAEFLSGGETNLTFFLVD